MKHKKTIKKTSQHEFENIVKRLTELRAKKNSDYGDGFIKNYDRYGQRLIFFDLLRKWQRLENILLTEKETQVSDETIEDTLGDLAVMSINAMIWLQMQKNKKINKIKTKLY